MGMGDDEKTFGRVCVSCFSLLFFHSSFTPHLRAVIAFVAFFFWLIYTIVAAENPSFLPAMGRRPEQRVAASSG
jgi:Na+/melibiose symporter-like transporter